MSQWYEIKDKEDCSISEDGKMLQINFDGDHNGNLWVEVPIKFIDSEFKDRIDELEDALRDSVSGTMDSTKYEKMQKILSKSITGL